MNGLSFLYLYLLLLLFIALGKYALLLVADLLEKLNMNHSLEMFSLESGFVSLCHFNYVRMIIFTLLVVLI
jgi:hypothetical protein